MPMFHINQAAILLDSYVVSEQEHQDTPAASGDQSTASPSGNTHEEYALHD